MVPTNRNKTGTISKHTGIQVQINDKDPRIDQVTSPNKSFLKKLNQNSSMDNLVSYHQHNFNINNRTINHNKTDFNNNSNICIGNASNRYSNIDIEQLWNNVNISITQPDQNQVNNSNSKNKRK